MTSALIVCSLMIIAACACGLYRLVKGPRLLDRILAFDFLCACIVALIALYSLHYATTLYLEILMIFSLLGFATVLSYMEILWTRASRQQHD